MELSQIRPYLIDIHVDLKNLKRALECADCRGTGGGGGGTDIPVVEDYQPLDCNDDPVGSPLTVVPVITLNKQDVRICNVDDIVTAGGLWNTNEIFITTPTEAFDLFSQLGDGECFHSVSTSVTGTAGQTADITVNGSTVNVPIGFSNTWEATTCLENNIIVEDSSDATVIFTTIKGLVL